MGTVYLLHFDTPYCHAGHYLGYTTDLPARLRRHRSGSGARLIEVITEHSIHFVVARVWSGTRELERRLKRQHNSPRMCPICRAARSTSHGAARQIDCKLHAAPSY